MSRGINKSIIVGIVCRDPETKATQSGMTVCNLTLVTNHTPKGGEEVPEFHRIVLFNRLGELADQYLSKGSQVYIEGRSQTRKYEKEGVTHYSHEVIANEMQFLGGRKDSGNNAATGHTEAPGGNVAPAADDDGLGDIPF